MPVRPRRLTLPLCLLGSPSLFLLYREATVCGTAAGCRALALAGYALAALLALPAAALVVRAVEADRVPSWLAPCPDDATLAVLGAIVACLGLFLAAAALDAVPPGLGDLLAPAGVLFGLPLVIVHAMLVGAANAVGEPSVTVQLLAVAFGVALSGAWWYLLAKTVARGLPHRGDPAE